MIDKHVIKMNQYNLRVKRNRRIAFQTDEDVLRLKKAIAEIYVSAYALFQLEVNKKLDTAYLLMCAELAKDWLTITRASMGDREALEIVKAESELPKE